MKRRKLKTKYGRCIGTITFSKITHTTMQFNMIGEKNVYIYSNTQWPHYQHPDITLCSCPEQISRKWSTGYISFMRFLTPFFYNLEIQFMKYFYFLFSGQFQVNCEQSFLEEPRSLISAPGGEVTFTCLVLNKGGECRWQKDGKVNDDNEIIIIS